MSRIVLDCDGPCADFDAGFYGLCRDLGIPDDWPMDRWSAWTHHLTEADQDWIRPHLDDPSFWRGLPVQPGAQEGVELMRAAGLEVVWATSPWEECPDWERVRRAWLVRHFGARPQDVVITARKELVGGMALIDDRPENVHAWACAHRTGRAFLFDLPHNRQSSRIFDRASWTSLARIDWLELALSGKKVFTK